MEEIGEPLPLVGELAVVVGGQGNRLCQRSDRGHRQPFDEVDEQFAYEYGEGLRTWPTGVPTVGSLGAGV